MEVVGNLPGHSAPEIPVYKGAMEHRRPLHVAPPGGILRELYSATAPEFHPKTPTVPGNSFTPQHFQHHPVPGGWGGGESTGCFEVAGCATVLAVFPPVQPAVPPSSSHEGLPAKQAGWFGARVLSRPAGLPRPSCNLGRGPDSALWVAALVHLPMAPSPCMPDFHLSPWSSG